MKRNMIRWKCPECSGGVNAPTRLRKLDVRRYCFDCSKRSGLLVERAAPVLDRKRSASAAKRAAAAKRERGQQAARRVSVKEREEARWTMPGFDYRIEATALWKLFVKRDPSLPSRPPKITLTSRGSGGGGTAWSGSHTIRISPSESRSWAWAMLVHELAHCAVRGKRATEGWHGPSLYKAMRDVIEKRLGIEISFASLTTLRGYKVDRVIEAQVSRFVRECRGEQVTIEAET